MPLQRKKSTKQFLTSSQDYLNFKLKTHPLDSFTKSQASVLPALFLLKELSKFLLKELSKQKLSAPPVFDMFDGLRTIWNAWLVKAVRLPRGLVGPRLASQAASLLEDLETLVLGERRFLSCLWIGEQGGEQGGASNSNGHSLSQSASHLSRARRPGFICPPPGCWSSSYTGTKMSLTFHYCISPSHYW